MLRHRFRTHHTEIHQSLMASNSRNFQSPNQSFDPNVTPPLGKRGRPPSEKKLLLEQAQAEARAAALARAQAQAQAAAAVASASASNHPQEADVVLPISRIRTIMKSSPDVVQIGHESLIIMTKATEYFIQHLAQEAFERRSNAQDVEYRDLATYVQENHGGTEFLNEIIPHKIKVRDLAALIANAEGGDGDQFDDADEDYST